MNIYINSKRIGRDKKGKYIYIYIRLSKSDEVDVSEQQGSPTKV
jgi:hypothetical protein